MTIQDFFLSLLLVVGLILLGKWIRRQVGVLRKLFLPSSIVAGCIALLLGAQVLGRFFAGLVAVRFMEFRRRT